MPSARVQCPVKVQPGDICLCPSGVVPEYQCQVKREAKKAQRERDRPNSTTSAQDAAAEAKRQRLLSVGTTEHSASWRGIGGIVQKMGCGSECQVSWTVVVL